ncbi:MAG TPA: TetR/AcrR family transcriptional regulator [Polyangiales bacterium]|nr:TetR/AcrR family transcriptional regulator [Polyangiales bacterium]
MSKGEQTRERILERAFRLAGREGLEGLSIGALASDLGLSKSGLFAHFGSKEDLQIAVLAAAAQRFQAAVIQPAVRGPRGVARVRRLFDSWLTWSADPSLPGGCLFIAAATELDDREGRARDFLVGSQRELLDFVAGTARQAIEQGEFRKDLDCEDFAFDLYALMLGFNHSRRLLRDPRSEERTRAAFERLVQFASR